MDRRQFSAGLLGTEMGVATGFAATEAVAVDLASRRHALFARKWIADYGGKAGFEVNLDRKLTTYRNDPGRTSGSFKFGEGEEMRNDKIFDEMPLEINANQPIIPQILQSLSRAKQIGAPNIDKLMKGATPAGKVYFKNETLIHSAPNGVYHDVSTMFLMTTIQIILVTGLIRAQRLNRISNLANIAGMPLVGTVYRTLAQEFARRNLIVFLALNGVK